MLFVRETIRFVLVTLNICKDTLTFAAVRVKFTVLYFAVYCCCC